MRPFDKARICKTETIDLATKESKTFSQEVMTATSKFLRLDFGETSPEDIIVNNDALKYKDRILAVYETTKGKIWIMAESENKVEYTVMTILFPIDN